MRKLISTALIAPIAAAIGFAGAGVASAATGTGSSGSSDSSPVQTVVVNQPDLQLAGVVISINDFETGASVDRTINLQQQSTIGFATWVGTTATGDTVLVFAVNDQLQIASGIQHVG
jgi:hypothetical protein